MPMENISAKKPLIIGKIGFSFLNLHAEIYLR